MFHEIIESAPVVVLLSGGQDSTTCLYWALRHKGVQSRDVYALTINYGQRHRLELKAAEQIADLAGVKHLRIDVPMVLLSTSPLIDSTRKVPKYGTMKELEAEVVEPTFVPMRNAFFLTIAANVAASLGARTIVTGVCEEDYGGYPDCRYDFLVVMEAMINRALGVEPGQVDDLMRLAAPLLRLNKASTCRLAAELPGCLDALALSHTCYDGCYPPNPHNHASILRARGFKEAGIPDPLIVRAKLEGLLPPDYPVHGLLVD